MLSDVKNPQGENLGIINSFVKDSEGRVAFAILLYDDYPLSIFSIPREVAVPFGALTFRNKVWILNASEKKLNSAPTFTSKKDLAAEGKKADNIYRYFGIQPFWTERGYTKEEGVTMGNPLTGRKVEKYGWGYSSHDGHSYTDTYHW
jgi:hypothetical protein